MSGRNSPAPPTDLAAAAPAMRPSVFVALHLNDIVHGSRRRRNVGLDGHESARGVQRDEREQAGGKHASDQKFAHVESLPTPPPNKTHQMRKFHRARNSPIIAHV